MFMNNSKSWIAVLKALLLAFLAGYGSLQFMGCKPELPKRFGILVCPEKEKDEDLTEACYWAYEVILDGSHPKAAQYRAELAQSNYIQVEACTCASNGGPELYRYAGDPSVPVVPIGETSVVVVPPPPPPHGIGDGLTWNYVIQISPEEMLDTIFTHDPDVPDITLSAPICPAADTVKIAVTDTGVDTDVSSLLNSKLFVDFWQPGASNPPCFTPANPYGFNFDKTSRNAIPQDAAGHGTAVNGIAAGCSDPKILLNGHAPKPLKIINGKMIEKNAGDLFHAMCALYYALDQGARVINISWGFGTSDGTLERPEILERFIQDAERRHVTIVAGMGNDGKDLEKSTVKFWPACFASNYDNVISVGAVDKDELRASSKNWKSNWSLAPREMTLVDLGKMVGVPALINPATKKPATWVGRSGTSFATPFVTRTVALMLGQNPSLLPAEIKARLVRAATSPAAKLAKTPGGRINNPAEAIGNACNPNY